MEWFYTLTIYWLYIELLGLVWWFVLNVCRFWNAFQRTLEDFEIGCKRSKEFRVCKRQRPWNLFQGNNEIKAAPLKEFKSLRRSSRRDLLNKKIWSSEDLNRPIKILQIKDPQPKARRFSPLEFDIITTNTRRLRSREINVFSGDEDPQRLSHLNQKAIFMEKKNDLQTVIFPTTRRPLHRRL